MTHEVIGHGRSDEELLPVTWRSDLVTRGLGLAVAASLVSGIAAVRSADPREPTPVAAAAAESIPSAVRVVVRVADPAAGARLYPTAEGIELRPLDGPSPAAARRTAQLVTNRVCRNIDRPRYRREGGSADGRTATFVVGRSSDTPRKQAGFVLRLQWRGDGYLAVVSGAYGGCASG